MSLNAANRGVVVWLTGLSGTGKTTVSEMLTEVLGEDGIVPVRLDGDRIRAAVPVPARHDDASRRGMAAMYGKLALEFASQGHLVVCSTISLFHAVHRWNRDNLPGYLEVWLRAPLAELRRRDPKTIYASGTEVVGVDLPAEYPLAADLVIENHGPISAREAALQIRDSLKEGHRI